MLFLKYFLLTAAIALFAGAAAVICYDVYFALERWRLLARATGETPPVAPRPRPIRWRSAVRLAAFAWAPLLLSLSIVVVPSGWAGVRVSQISGTRPGTLYPGIHLVKPFLEQVALYDIRDRVFTTGTPAKLESAKKEAAAGPRPADLLTVQSKEGLTIGFAVTVRFSLDPKRLDSVHANLPQPVDVEIVHPVVASVFRQVAPNYTVREIFATRREEVRQHTTGAIIEKLSPDGIVIKEVMLRDVILPPEYAEGLEGLLLKAQESERLAYEIEIKQKQVRTAELEAEAQKARDIKRAEAAAQVRVLQAKGEADAMQYTLPLKEKQIQQSRLEAQANKEATLKNAEGAAEAKVIDSKAELERRKLLAEADANRIRVTSEADATRIRVTAAADAERLRLEAIVLKENPLLIQKIIAERLSDKLQIVMVPSDGKNFFANDVLRSTLTNGHVVDDSPRKRPPQ